MAKSPHMPEFRAGLQNINGHSSYSSNFKTRCIKRELRSRNRIMKKLGVHTAIRKKVTGDSNTSGVCIEK